MNLMPTMAAFVFHQNGSTGTSTLTFYAEQGGNAQVAAYTIDGRKVTGLTHGTGG